METKAIFKALVHDVMNTLTVNHDYFPENLIPEKTFFNSRKRITISEDVSEHFQRYYTLLFEAKHALFNDTISKIEREATEKRAEWYDKFIASIKGLFRIESDLDNKEALEVLFECLLCKMKEEKDVEIADVISEIKKSGLFEFSSEGERMMKPSVLSNSEIYTSQKFVLDKTLANLSAQIRCDYPVFLVGKIGCGKYSVAAEYAERNKYKYDAIIFVKWEGDLPSTFANINTDVDSIYDFSEKERRIKYILKKTDQKILLVIYDLNRKLKQNEEAYLFDILRGKIEIVFTVKSDCIKGKIIKVEEPSESQFEALFHEHTGKGVNGYKSCISRLRVMADSNLGNFMMLLTSVKPNIEQLTGKLWNEYTASGIMAAATRFEGSFKNHNGITFNSVYDYMIRNSNVDLLSSEENEVLFYTALLIGDSKNSKNLLFRKNTAKRILMEVIPELSEKFIKKCECLFLLRESNEMLDMDHLFCMMLIGHYLNTLQPEKFSSFGNRVCQLSYDFCENDKRMGFEKIMDNFMINYIANYFFQNQNLSFQHLWFSHYWKLLDNICNLMFPIYCFRKSDVNPFFNTVSVIFHTFERSYNEYIYSKALKEITDFALLRKVSHTITWNSKFILSKLIGILYNVKTPDETNNLTQQYFMLTFDPCYSNDAYVSIFWLHDAYKADDAQKFTEIAKEIAGYKNCLLIICTIKLLVLHEKNEKYVGILFNEVEKANIQHSEFDKIDFLVMQEMFNLIINNKIDIQRLKEEMTATVTAYQFSQIFSLLAMTTWILPDDSAVEELNSIIFAKSSDEFLKSKWVYLLKNIDHWDNKVFEFDTTIRYLESAVSALDEIHIFCNDNEYIKQIHKMMSDLVEALVEICDKDSSENYVNEKVTFICREKFGRLFEEFNQIPKLEIKETCEFPIDDAIKEKYLKNICEEFESEVKRIHDAVNLTS